MDKGAWWATVQRVSQSQTQLKQLSTHPRPLSLLQRGLAPRSKGKARAELRPARFLPGESQGRGSLVGCHLWGCTPTTHISSQQPLGQAWGLPGDKVKR